MTLRPHYVLAVVLLLLQATGIASAAQQRDTSLEGVWRFVEEVDRRSDGSVVKTGPADGYNGLLIFANGYMSSTIMPKGRSWRRDTVSPAELRETFEDASAHAGRYEPDSVKRTIRFDTFLSLDPADEGKSDAVAYRVERDTLEISGPWTYKGEKLTFTIRLTRLR